MGCGDSGLVDPGTVTGPAAASIEKLKYLGWSVSYGDDCL